MSDSSAGGSTGGAQAGGTAQDQGGGGAASSCYPQGGGGTASSCYLQGGGGGGRASSPAAGRGGGGLDLLSSRSGKRGAEPPPLQAIGDEEAVREAPRRVARRGLGLRCRFQTMAGGSRGEHDLQVVERSGGRRRRCTVEGAPRWRQRNYLHGGSPVGSFAMMGKKREGIRRILPRWSTRL